MITVRDNVWPKQARRDETGPGPSWPSELVTVGASEPNQNVILCKMQDGMVWLSDTPLLSQIGR
jgi:hypothetical protein